MGWVYYWEVVYMGYYLNNEDDISLYAKENLCLINNKFIYIYIIIWCRWDNIYYTCICGMFLYLWNY
jgi:hypothetical protein